MILQEISGPVASFTLFYQTTMAEKFGKTIIAEPAG